MAAAVVIGELLAVEGYALAGVVVLPAQSQAEAVSAWQAIPPDTALLIMTANVAAWLADRVSERPELLTAVMPP